jgi:Ras-related protein Rab-7A
MEPGYKKLVFKTNILGSPAVGKTSLVERFVRNCYIPNRVNTLLGDFATKDVSIDNMQVTLQFWDTAGQERFSALSQSFYRNAKACILVYDITRPTTFQSLSYWRDQLLQAFPSDYFPFVLLGNKCDLEADRSISRDQAEAWCEANGHIPYFETSAKDNINVVEAIETAAQRALAREATEMPPPAPQKRRCSLM